MKKTSLAIALISTLLLGACDGDDGATGPAGPAGAAGAQGPAGPSGTNGVTNLVTTEDVVKTNANIAYAVYADSLITVQTLRKALKTFVNSPTDANFSAAKQAWLNAREPYGQTEVYRFRVGPIDALKGDGTIGSDGDGPEGRINAWPLGEALIDYVVAVDGDIGPQAPANVIEDVANYPVFNKAVLEGLFEKGEDERNVSTGYHAIEFLLWGQDLNADLSSGEPTRDATAGHRPATDYHTTANGNAGTCTSGTEAKVENICQRRADYLMAAVDLLVDDLTAVTNAWEPGAGTHYKTFIAGGDTSLAKILEGMGRLSFGELAGERMFIAVNTDSQEDEHSCFSDNTHRDIFLNAKAIQNSYLGSYTRVDGEVVSGASVQDLLVVKNAAELANKLRGSIEATMAAASVIDTKAKTGKPFDVLIQEGIRQPNVMAVIAGLVKQTDDIEQAISALGVTTNDLRQDTEEPITGG